MNTNIRQIIRKDLFCNYQNARIQILSIAVICLTVLTTLLGVSEYQLRKDRYQNEVEANAAALEENVVYATITPKAIRPPELLSIISQGVESDLGNSFTFSMLEIPFQANKIYESNEYTSSFMSLDLVTIFIWMLSLISILISYDVVTKEKEDSTLKLLLASNVSRFEFLTAKIFSSLVTIFFILLLTCLIVIAWLFFTPWVDMNGAVVGSIVLFFALSFLYSAIWICIGVLSSITQRSSSRSLVVCLAAWVTFLLLIPATIRTLVGNTNFNEEKQEIHAMYTEIEKEYYDSMDRIWGEQINPLIRNLEFSTFGGSPGSEPIIGPNPKTMEAAVNYYRILNPLKEDLADRKYAIAENKYILPFRRKIDLSDKLSYLSPVTVFQNASTMLSGTSYNEYFSFLEGFREYRNNIIRYFNDKNALSSSLWFSPEGLDYPYAPGNSLRPQDPDKPTDAELDALIEHYRNWQAANIDVGDFPKFQMRTDKATGGTCVPAVIYAIIIIGLLIAISFYRIDKYDIT